MLPHTRKTRVKVTGIVGTLLSQNHRKSAIALPSNHPGNSRSNSWSKWWGCKGNKTLLRRLTRHCQTVQIMQKNRKRKGGQFVGKYFPLYLIGWLGRSEDFSEEGRCWATKWMNDGAILHPTLKCYCIAGVAQVARRLHLLGESLQISPYVPKKLKHCLGTTFFFSHLSPNLCLQRLKNSFKGIKGKLFFFCLYTCEHY